MIRNGSSTIMSKVINQIARSKGNEAFPVFYFSLSKCEDNEKYLKRRSLYPFCYVIYHDAWKLQGWLMIFPNTFLILYVRKTWGNSCYGHRHKKQSA